MRPFADMHDEAGKQIEAHYSNLALLQEKKKKMEPEALARLPHTVKNIRQQIFKLMRSL